MTIVYRFIASEFDANAFWSDAKSKIASLELEDAFLADLMGLSVSSIRKIKSEGKWRPEWIPTIKTFLEICNALELEPTLYFVMASDT